MSRSFPRAEIEDLLLMAGFTRAERDVDDRLAGNCVTKVVGDLHRLGLPQRDDDCYEPIETFNRMISAGLGREQPFWRDRCVRTGQRLACALWNVDDRARAPKPRFIEQLPPKRFRVELTRRFELSRDFGPGPLRIRLPLPIEDQQLRDLAVESVGCPGGAVSIGSDRIEAKVAPERSEATLSATFTFEALPGKSAPTAGEFASSEAWLADHEGPIRVTPALAALAARLCEGARSVRERVQRLYDHLLGSVKIGMVAYDLQSSASEPAGWLDCRLASARLVSLCRAMGIPARLVGGYLLWDAPTEHYWMEALVEDDGWAPFDFLAWDLSAGGSIAEWRGVYAGVIDYRMKTQCFPRTFTGAPGISMGQSWRRLFRSVPGGAETRYVASNDGRLLYSETVCVTAG